MGKMKYPLLSEAFNNKDIQCAIKVIRSKTEAHITMQNRLTFSKLNNVFFFLIFMNFFDKKN